MLPWPFPRAIHSICNAAPLLTSEAPSILPPPFPVAGFCYNKPSDLQISDPNPMARRATSQPAIKQFWEMCSFSKGPLMYDVRTWSFFQYIAAPTFHNRIHEGHDGQNCRMIITYELHVCLGPCSSIIVSFHEVPSEAFTCLLNLLVRCKCK